MMGLFSGFSLGSPLFLMFLPVLAAGLLALYRHSGRSTPVRIGTSYLLKHFEGVYSRPESLRLPLRFFIELALLSLLMLGAVSLLKSKGEKGAIVLIDNSLSMSKEYSRGSVWSRATTTVQRILNRLQNGEAVMLYQSAPELRALTPEPVSSSLAMRKVSELKPSATGDNLEGAVAQLLGSHPESTLHIVTDRSSATRYRGSESVFVHSVGIAPSKDEVSIALGQLNYRSAARGELAGGLVSTSVVAYGGEPVPVKLTLSALDLKGVRQLATKDLTLTPEIEEKIQFELESGGSSLAYRLEVSAAQGNSDVLFVDNIRYAVAGESSAIDWLVVSELSSADLGIGQLLPGASLHLKASEYADWLRANPDLKGSKYAIFYRAAPPVLPSIPTALIAPPRQSQWVESETVEAPTAVAFLQDAHPLLSYLKFGSSRLAGVTPLRVPSWARPLIELDGGQVVLAAGVHSGVPVALSGLDLLPFQGEGEARSSVLLLNIVKWLEASQQSVQSAGGFLLPGSTVKAPSVTQIVQLTTNGERSISIDTPLAKGVYRLSGNEKQETWHVVDAVAMEEAAPAAQSRLVLPASTRNLQSESTSDSQDEVTYLLALVVLLLLMVDFLATLKSGVMKFWGSNAVSQAMGGSNG